MTKSIIVGLITILWGLPLATRAGAQPQFATIYNATNGFPGGLSHGNGALYTVVTATGVGECSSVFELQPPSAVGGQWAGTVLYTFPSTGGLGCGPTDAPTPAPDGSLYGLDDQAGVTELYQLLPPSSPGEPWTERALCTIPLIDGQVQSAVSGLVSGPGGSFYLLTGAGLAQFVPPGDGGASWTFKMLYVFPDEPYAPLGIGGIGGLIAGPDGSLYSKSCCGGFTSEGFGTVFQLIPPKSAGGAWSLNILYSFGKKGDGGDPFSLVLADDGTLFGVTYGPPQPRTSGAAVAFQLSPPAPGESTWSYTVLYNFGLRHPDSTILLRDGNLYVAASSPDGGDLYELQPPATPGAAWTTTVLHHFGNNQSPYGQLIMNEDGTIFGTTGNLSPPANLATGTIYVLNPN